jgi:hypothetical protein
MPVFWHYKRFCNLSHYQLWVWGVDWAGSG